MSNRPAWVCEITLAEYHMGWNRVNALAGDVATRRPPKDSFYAQYLRTPHWRKFRGEILIVARFRCADCGGQAKEVHHLHYRSLWRETWHDVVPICEVCHEKRHGLDAGIGADVEKILAQHKPFTPDQHARRLAELSAQKSALKAEANRRQ